MTDLNARAIDEYLERPKVGLTTAITDVQALLWTCREGTFYEDHDQSLEILANAEAGLALLIERLPRPPHEVERGEVRGIDLCCVNCSVPLGGRHDVLCHTFAKKRKAAR